MYLLMILFITVVAPFLVMPRYITKGGRNPYDVVLISVITICAAAAVIFMGASMVGDGVEVGCGSILNPGSVIGRNCSIYPLSSVRGCVDEGSIYKNQGEIVKKQA